MFLRRLFRRRSAVIGLLLVLAFCLLALLAPVLAPPLNPDDPWPFKNVSQSFSRQPLPPEPGLPRGTTPQIQNMPQYGIAPGQHASYQWDVYYTLVWGSRSALRFGLVVTLATALIGVAVGIVSGYVGGLSDLLTMRVIDAFLAFPVIAGVWVIQRAFYGNIYNPFGDPMALTGWEAFLYRARIDPIMITFILFSWMPYARLMNAQARRVKGTDYVRAAEAMGATGGRVMWRHILPNTIAPAIVLAAPDVGGMVFLASAATWPGGRCWSAAVTPSPA